MINYLKLTFFGGRSWRNLKAENMMELVNRWSCTNNFYKKNFWRELYSHWLQLPTKVPRLLQAFFSIGCKKRHRAVFWSRSRIETRLLFTFPLSGRDSLFLFWLALLYSPSPFLLGRNIFKSNSLSPFCLFGQNFSKSNSSSLFSSDKNILNPTSIPQKNSKTIPNSEWVAKPFHFRKNILSPIFFLTWKNSLDFAYPFHALASAV